MLCYHIIFLGQNDANYAISKKSTSYINRKWQHVTTKWAGTKLQAQSRLDSLASFRTNQIICSLVYVPVVFKFKFCYLFAFEYKYKQHIFFLIIVQGLILATRGFCSRFYLQAIRSIGFSVLPVNELHQFTGSRSSSVIRVNLS